MAPIRLGFIGLSADGQWASRAHLPYIQSHPSLFTITALQNSSVASSRRSIEKYDLDASSITCHDNADSLAADPNVDMVVVSVKVPHHYELMKPALLTNKAVFVEWPLAADLQQAEELTKLAREKGVKNFVGLQGRQSPSIIKAKQLVEDGELGEILGTTMIGHGGVLGETTTEPYVYLADKKNGANLVTIPVGHAIDALCFVLGEMTELSANLDVRRPKIELLDSDGKKVKTIEKTSHDYMAVTGTLERGGGIVSVVYQGGSSDTGKNFYWEINGTKGTLVLEASSGHIQMVQPSIKIVKKGEGVEKLKEVEVEKADRPAYNVGKAWDAIAGEGNGKAVTFQDALVRHRMIEAFYKSAETGRRESYL